MYDVEAKLNELETSVGVGGTTWGLSNLQRTELLEMMYFGDKQTYGDSPEDWQARLESLSREIILKRQSQTLDSGPIVPLPIDLHNHAS